MSHVHADTSPPHMGDGPAMSTAASSAGAQPAAPVLVFIFFLFLYLFTASGHIESSDGNAMFAVTQNVVRFGNLHTHSPYGLTLSLIAIPFYLLGLALAHLLHVAGDYPLKAAVSLTNAPITALTCALLAVIAQRLGVRRGPAVVLALVYGTCTLAWPYAKTFFSEPLTTLLLLIAFWALLHIAPTAREPTSRSSPPASLWMGLAVAALGLAVLTRETTVIVLPVFALYGVTRIRARSDRARLVLVAALVAAVSLAIVAGWNVARYGSPLSTGYGGHLWTLSLLPGLYGLLIGPYKGVLLYVPLTIVAALSWPRFYRRCPDEALLCGGIGLVYLIVHAAYIDWPGGGNWGPRFLVPAVPFVLLALPFGWARSPRWTWATALLCLAGLLVQLPAVYVSYARYYPLVGSREDTALVALVNRHPERSPIIEQWRSVPVVTAQLRQGRANGLADLTQKVGGQATSSLPLNQVLRSSITVNVPDFWFVYLALSGHAVRLVRVAVGLLALAVAMSGLMLARTLR